MVKSRANTLHNPKVDAANIVGINWTLDIKHMLKAAIMPNLANIINIGTKLVLFQNIIRSVVPKAESVYIEVNPNLGPI